VLSQITVTRNPTKVNVDHMRREFRDLCAQPAKYT
jgi:hypothetical protein